MRIPLNTRAGVAGRTDRARSALAVVLTVGRIVHSPKVVTLHYPLKAFTLAGTYGYDLIAFYEYFVDGNRLSESLRQIHVAKLDYITLWTRYRPP